MCATHTRPETLKKNFYMHIRSTMLHILAVTNEAVFWDNYPMRNLLLNINLYEEGIHILLATRLKVREFNKKR